jgi:hypothetical protein
MHLYTIFVMVSWACPKRNHHDHLLLFLVILADRPYKYGEGTLNNSHVLAFGEVELRLKRFLTAKMLCCHR